jgi:ectoine hydroxylase-related dioxygenase (phytanoyl-CoA dioxygenase family)
MGEFVTAMEGAPGLLGPRGYRRLQKWTPPGRARAWATGLVATHRGSMREVLRNPHHTEEWAQAVVRAPRLLAAVQGLIGPSVAVENTFLVIKWPGRGFEVPWHQDGINDRLELDPAQSVAAWLALTDAAPGSGCLRVLPGSQASGYLPYEVEAAHGAPRGRALGIRVSDGEQGHSVPVQAGSGLLMDTRLVHSSPSNNEAGARIGLNIRFVAPGAIRMRDGSSPSPTPLSGTGW